MITFTINKTVTENWSKKYRNKETQQLHLYILLRNSQHPNITKTAAISLSVTVKITIKKVYYDSTIKYVCTGQAPKQKCQATQIDATNGPRNAWPAVHAWLATHASPATHALPATHEKGSTN